MSYVITGVKRKDTYTGGNSNSGNNNQQLKSRAASVDEVDQYGNGAVAVATYAGVLKTILDDQGAGTIYIGEAAPGSSVAAPVWRIKKLVTTAGVTPIEFAVTTNPDGTALVGGFNHIWNNRAALTYA
jgi:hypothetical protein